MFRKFFKATILTLALSSFLVFNYFHKKENSNLESINIHYPFVFSKSVHPKKLFSVGDQVISEHIFAFHIQLSLKNGMRPLFSDYKVIEKPDRDIVVLDNKYKVRDSNGTKLQTETICENLRNTFQEAQHTPYSKLLKKVVCNEDKIEIHLTKTPLNLKFLFTLPDFAIVDVQNIPVTNANKNPTTGPYSIDEITDKSVHLKMNPHFPKELRANEVQNIHINNYVSANTKSFIENLNVREDHFAYFFGHTLDEEDIKIIEEKNYNIEVYPNEWLIFFGIKNSVNKHDRNLLRKTVDQLREDVEKDYQMANKTYSISPNSRPFALKQNEYNKLNTYPANETRVELENNLTISTLETWYEIPVFKQTISKLLKTYGEKLKLKLYKAQEIQKLFRNDTEVVMSPLGISHFDPISHISFLRSNFDGIDALVTEKELSELAIISDEASFNKKVKIIEGKIISSKLITPLFHFPGIVASSPAFKKKSNLSFSWGIQAWVYEIN